MRFPAGKVLISKTDTKGIITYCNDEFENISGYSRAELIGKSHNIVRHPDMPPQAFEWLWDTLKQGLPWRGVVKNRCKNGDHYWVRATVAPIIENNQVNGYVSVRQEPTRAQVLEAESLYRGLNQSGAKVVSRYERLRFRNWPINYKLSLFVQSALLVMFGLEQEYFSPVMSQVILQLFMFFFLAFCVNKLVNERLRTISASMKEDIRVSLESEVDIDGRDKVGRLMCSIQSMRTFLRTMVDEISSPVTRIQDRIKDLDSTGLNSFGKRDDRTGSYSGDCRDDGAIQPVGTRSGKHGGRLTGRLQINEKDRCREQPQHGAEHHRNQ